MDEPLDRVVAGCSESRTREHLRDAVACLGGGAPRACVVRTCTAVFVDLAAKLGGPPPRGSADEPALLQAGVARGLLTARGGEEIEQLRRSRDFALFPGRGGGERPVTAERATALVRRVARLLLHRRALAPDDALAGALAAIDAPGFPRDPAGARAWLTAGPLAGASAQLLASCAQQLVVRVLAGAGWESQFHRVAALAGLLSDAATTEALTDVLPAALAGLPDERVVHALVLVAGAPTTWSLAGPVGQARLLHGLAGGGAVSVHFGLAVPALRPAAVSRLAAAGVDDLRLLIALGDGGVCVDRSVALFLAEPDADAAATIAASLLVPLAGVLTDRQIAAVVARARDVRALARSWSLMHDSLPAVLDAGPPGPIARPVWRALIAGLATDPGATRLQPLRQRVAALAG